MIHITFQYGAFEAPFDAFDYILAEKYEKAINNYSRKIKALNALKKDSAMLKKIVDTVADFFAEIFDEQAGNQVLGSSTSANDALNAMLAFNRFYKAQVDVINDIGSQLEAENAIKKYVKNELIN